MRHSDRDKNIIGCVGRCLFKLWSVTDEKFIDYKYIHFVAIGAIDFVGNLGTWMSVSIFKCSKISRCSQCMKEQVGKCAL